MNTVYRGRDANVRETLRILVQARRAGVTLFAKVDGELGLTADRLSSGELLAVIEAHQADILALLPPPRVERAKRTIWQLQALGFRARLDGGGALLIADTLATGKKRRDVSQYLPIAEVFDDLVAGLAVNPQLLDDEERVGQ